MSLFNRKPKPAMSSAVASQQNQLAQLVLSSIHDGVIITDRMGVIQFVNPAAVAMLDGGSPEAMVGLDYSLWVKLESKEGRELSDDENPLTQAMRSGQPLDNCQVCLVAGAAAKRIPIALTLIPTAGGQSSRIITFRNIAKELAEEGEQTEFVSTASHEMRTPIASIEGYLSLALNPQTATIDDRARTYLTSAHQAAQHLGQLFRDLLDVTKVDDGHIRPHLEPVEMMTTVKHISDEYAPAAKAAHLSYQFGSAEKGPGDVRRLEQVVYGFVDVNFMREIMDNLIGNAIKYTPEGGSIYVNVRGDGDRVLINVTDTGIGISSDDIGHIFQKFYRADNSDTRTIGGTGLGLYLVKQRVEAMGGRVWAESGFGEGSTFFVSLPRLTSEEYEKRLIAVRNQNMVNPHTITAGSVTDMLNQQALAQQMAQSGGMGQPGGAGQMPQPAPTMAAPPQPMPTAPIVPPQPLVSPQPISQPTTINQNGGI